MFKKILYLFLISLFLIGCQAQNSVPGFNKGHLLIIGGGKRPDNVMKKFIELAGGFGDGKILVLPMASGDPDGVGEYQADQFKKLGAKNASYLIVSGDEAKADSSIAKLDSITGIFFSGGAQSRLVDAIGGTPFLDKIFKLYQAGAVIGGTSAGAAVMSEMMITGDEKRPDENPDRAFIKIEGSNIITARGFGFLKNVIVDQHFVRRKRQNRLVSLVLENPKLVGMGIDESTAVIFQPNETFEVMGENSVILYDARKANVLSLDSTNSFNLAASNINFHILTNGYKFNLKNNLITAPTYDKN